MKRGGRFGDKDDDDDDEETAAPAELQTASPTESPTPTQRGFGFLACSVKTATSRALMLRLVSRSAPQKQRTPWSTRRKRHAMFSNKKLGGLWGCQRSL
jgi:septal ring-binding cell division protein DamX